MGICKDCIQKKIWLEQMNEYDKKHNDDCYSGESANEYDDDFYPPTCPCSYCALNNFGYA